MRRSRTKPSDAFLSFRAVHRLHPPGPGKKVGVWKRKLASLQILTRPWPNIGQLRWNVKLCCKLGTCSSPEIGSHLPGAASTASTALSPLDGMLREKGHEDHTGLGGRERSFSASEEVLMRRYPSVGQCGHLSLARARTNRPRFTAAEWGG